MQHSSFGAWLENKRRDTPLRLFAEQVGVDNGTISRTEREQTDVLVLTAIRICRGLGLSCSDFFQEWQGRAVAGFDQSNVAEGQAVLTIQEVQQWLLRILQGHRRNRELLIAALNMIVLRSGLLVSPLPSLSQLFSLADIEKLLWDLPWFHFDIAPPLEQESLTTTLPVMYQQRGLILPQEIGAYIAQVRKQQKLTLKQLGEASHIPTGILTSIENGLVKHLKLYDLLLLDDCLEQHGKLLTLYWWEAENRLMLEQSWRSWPLAESYSLCALHKLVSVLISVGRWLQSIYAQDTTWLAMIRHELGLTQPEARKEPAL